jgi:hypothetical protein
VAREIDEDLIEATIRRVAESKAAREAPAIEMPVAESIAPEIETPAVELAIEHAEREASPVSEAPPVHETPPAREAQPVREAPARALADDDDIEVMPTPLNASARGRGIDRGVATAAAPKAAAALPARQDGDGIAQQLAEIKHQLDAITDLLYDLTDSRRAAPPIGPAWEQAAASSAPRPPIFREEASRPVAPVLEPDVIDTRPIPEPLPPLHVEPKRGFDLLPRSYRITVEDKRRGVDLVPLHRAMLSMEGVRDMSLLSYNNGIAIVALETTEELSPDALGAQVSRAMSRPAKVEVHNEHTMVVKLAEE